MPAASTRSPSAPQAIHHVRPLDALQRDRRRPRREHDLDEHDALGDEHAVGAVEPEPDIREIDLAADRHIANLQREPRRSRVRAGYLERTLICFSTCAATHVLEQESVFRDHRHLAEAKLQARDLATRQAGVLDDQPAALLDQLSPQSGGIAEHDAPVAAPQLEVETVNIQMLESRTHATFSSRGSEPARSALSRGAVDARPRRREEPRVEPSRRMPDHVKRSVRLRERHARGLRDRRGAPATRCGRERAHAPDAGGDRAPRVELAQQVLDVGEVVERSEVREAKEARDEEDVMQWGGRHVRSVP